ncbi:MAG: hypothetical protein H7644_05445 [Candidatus Heimdallarchaeota archaeon]|nr:hypothetical protein [Candidatus Heimdallarchaeota archaeon]MCK5143190.1 hypothetical protein [Candidatus Heimdallarchaeota archaeon]
MADMSNAKKKVIRSRAKHFAIDLWDAPLNQGLHLYQETMNDLYKKSSRLRICLKCGAIDTIQDLTEDTHNCALDFNSFPVLVTTSWIKMADFFLTDKRVKALHKIGVETDREVEAVTVTTYPEVSEIVASSSSKAKSKADSTDRIR